MEERKIVKVKDFVMIYIKNSVAKLSFGLVWSKMSTGCKQQMKCSWLLEGLVDQVTAMIWARVRVYE